MRGIGREKLWRERALGQAPRDQAVDADIVELHLQSGLARQDQQLAGDVLAGQILARIGLGVAEPVGFANERAEWNGAVERVEQVAERPREDSLHPRDHVAADDQIAQRRDDGQPGADVGLVEEMLLLGGQQLAQRRVAAPRQNVRALVRRDDVQVGLDELRVGVDHGRFGRTVDERGVREFEPGNLVRQRARIHPP